MKEIIRRTPYAVLIVTLAMVIGATWLASNMGGTIIVYPTETFSSYTFPKPTPNFNLTNYNTYWIGAEDGLIYIHNNMDYNIQAYSYPTFPTDPNSYKPFISFKIMNDLPVSVKNDVNEAMRNSYATNNSNVIFYMMTYNPVIVAGAQPDVTISITTSLSSSKTTIIRSEEYVNWTYRNTKIQKLYSYLQLNAEEINPLVYYRAAYAFEQLQMAKLAAFYYRYNIFLNQSENIFLPPGVYTINKTQIVSCTTSTMIMYYYNYGSLTNYPKEAVIAFPLFFNNQLIIIKQYQTKYYSSSLSISYSYDITVKGDPYPPYNTFTNMLKAAEILFKNYGVNDAVKLNVNTATLGLITNMIFYTYSNELYPTALIYAYTGISPEPFPGFNDVYLRANTEVTMYEYFMPIYPAFVVQYGGTITGQIYDSNLAIITKSRVLGGGNYYQTLVTYIQTGRVTFTATIPIIISKGEATKTIIVSIIPGDNTNTSWTTTIVTTYRCISRRTITATVTVPFTIKTVTDPVITKNFYVLVTITEKFPLYPTVPLYDVVNGTTTYLGIELITTTSTKELVFTSYIPKTTTVSNSVGKYVTTTLTTTLTTITVTFTSTAYKTITTFTQNRELTARSPLIFVAGFTKERDKMTIGEKTTETVVYYPGGSSTTTLKMYSVWNEPIIWFFTKTTSHDADYVMPPASIDKYMKSLVHFFSIPTDVTMTMFIPTLSLSPTVSDGTTSYIVSLYVSTSIYTNTTTVSMVTRNPYVTAFMLVAKYTFSVSTSSTRSIETDAYVITTTVDGATVTITSYRYTIHETTYYWTVAGDSPIKITYSTVSLITTYNGVTFLNQTLTKSMDTYAVRAMSDIYTANKKIMFNGEVLATRIAAANLFVAYANLDNYENLLNIRGQWIINPTPIYYQSYSIIPLTTEISYSVILPTPRMTTTAIYYNSYSITTAILAINTGYIDPFEALLFKAPARPLELFTSLLKINFPGIFGINYTTYYITTIDKTSPKLTSKVYTSAAAFLLLTETANPQDNVVVNYLYMEYTTVVYNITIPFGDIVITACTLQEIVTVTMSTTTTYPVVQYYLSSVPYVYVIPIPTGTDTQMVKYILTMLSYKELEEVPVFLGTMETTVQNSTTHTMYMVTTISIVTTFPASTVVAYISPVYLGLYLIYGMESTTSTFKIVTPYIGGTIETDIIITGSYWINKSWYVPWLQEIYVPVVVTDTIYIQTLPYGPWASTSIVNEITGYVLQIYQDVNLPKLTYNASDGVTMFNFGDFVSVLEALTTYPAGTNMNGAMYIYTNVVPDEKPFYMLSATSPGSWVVAEYLAVGSVPLIYVPSVSGSSIELDTKKAPQLVPATFTPVIMTGNMNPMATFGWKDSNTPPIVEFYYTVPYYAAFYNLPMYAPTVTSLYPEWSQAPDVMSMYLPASKVITTTYVLVTTDTFGFPEIASTLTKITTIYYGSPLPYTFTKVTVGKTVYTYNPLPTTPP